MIKINFKFSEEFLESDPILKEKVVKHLILFLKKEKEFFRFINFFKTNSFCELESFSLGHLIMLYYTREIQKDGHVIAIEDKYLLLSQSWRIYLLDNFQEIFGCVGVKLQKHISKDLISKINANCERMPMKSRKTIANFYKRNKSLSPYA